MNDELWLVVHRTDGKPPLICGPFESVADQIAFEPNVPHEMVSLHDTLLDACAEQSNSWAEQLEADRHR